MSAAEIIAEAGKAFGLTYDETIGQCRQRRFVAARAAATLALRKRGMSYPQIGKRLGERDHSTVINYVKTHTRLLEDAKFAQLVDRLSAMAVKSLPTAAVEKFVYAINEPAPPPKIPKTPRRMFRDGEIDGDELTEAEFNAMLVNGSRLLNDAIASQFRFGAAA